MASGTRLLLIAAVILTSRLPRASAQIITEFPLPMAGSTPLGITAGPDGNLWFTEYSGNKIGRITTNGAIAEFTIPTPGSGAAGITSGPDGALWFTQSNANKIGRITTAGAITEFPIPTGDSRPFGIAAGSDGNLWFTEAHGNNIGRITIVGIITEFGLPPNSVPAAIAAGPDGALWFTENSGTRNRPHGIGRITTEGAITEFIVPNVFPIALGAIAAGPDGALWFADNGGPIRRITISGVITEFRIPTAGGYPLGIAAGPDSALWFTENAGQIGRITTAGVITEFPIPTADSRPYGIAAGADGALWFTERGGIGRITTGFAPVPTLILPVVGSTTGVGGSFFRTSVQLHNAGTTPSSGRIVFHPSGTPGSNGDPGLNFTLAPGQTQTIPDLLPAMGTSGLGSADVTLTVGSAGNVTIVSARVFNDAGAAGTTGFAFNALNPDEALQPGRRGVLTIPADLTNFRMNIGVRTLDAAVLMTVTVRDAAGAIAAAVPKFFPATYHEQQTASAFLNGLPLPPGGSITALMEAGAAFVYGATVDNRTGDPSLQVAAPAR